MKKRLVLCCDGTWNSADQSKNGKLTPTNVVKLAYRVAKRAPDGTPQVLFYDQGVGTGNSLDRLTGGAFGDGLEDNIFDAFRFLVANYVPGDEIFLFGFSRGAFTARSIAGMIRKCGILKRTSVGRYVEALSMYQNPKIHPDDDDAVGYRQRHSCCTDEMKIRFVGVWDTVGALGIPLRGLRGLTRGKYEFHDTQLSGIVEHAYHALAIDERRSPFEATLWEEVPKPGQWVEQVWFAGVHSDIGGGYPESQLSDVALEWMLAKAAEKGLALDPEVQREFTLAPDGVRGQLHDSKTGLYRLTKGFDRPIGTKPRAEGGTQSVHPSVLERWDADPSYRPANLRKYFEATGDARGRGRG